jgi:hypothetical protein
MQIIDLASKKAECHMIIGLEQVGGNHLEIPAECIGPQTPVCSRVDQCAWRVSYRGVRVKDLTEKTHFTKIRVVVGVHPDEQ